MATSRQWNSTDHSKMDDDGRVTFRWPRLSQWAGPLLMTVVIIATPLSHHTRLPGLVLALLIGSELALLAARYGRPTLVVPSVLIAASTGLVAMRLAPQGLAEVPVLVAATLLPAHLSSRHRWTLGVGLAVAFGAMVCWISASAVGALAGGGLLVLVQRTTERAELAEQRDRALALLTELQATREAETRAAAAEERTRIARDMHDVLAHNLSGLSLQLQAIRALAAREHLAATITEPLDRAAELARDGVAEARDAVGALRQPAEHGLTELPDLVVRFPAGATLHSTGAAGRLSPLAEDAVYRAVQESLTNAARYAPGAQVTVGLDWHADSLRVRVRDSGRKADRRPLDLGGTGNGLLGMRERIEACGGRVEAGPDGPGWLVYFEVPTMEAAI
jgi:signal transduction histidine kinase